jgi:hypothetical protein
MAKRIAKQLRSSCCSGFDPAAKRQLRLQRFLAQATADRIVVKATAFAIDLADEK